MLACWLNREVATAACTNARTTGQTLPVTAPKHAGMALRTLRYLPGGCAQGVRAGAHLTVSPRAIFEGPNLAFCDFFWQLPNCRNDPVINFGLISRDQLCAHLTANPRRHERSCSNKHTLVVYSFTNLSLSHTHTCTRSCSNKHTHISPTQPLSLF
jgi:hypothetical protein